MRIGSQLEDVGFKRISFKRRDLGEEGREKEVKEKEKEKEGKANAMEKVLERERKKCKGREAGTKKERKNEIM